VRGRLVAASPRRHVRVAVLLGLLWITQGPPLHAETSWRPGDLATATPSPPGSELRISILTFGVGAEVWERFGHNAIVVADLQQGTRTAYNYGMFSFHQENFVLRFIQGRMLYWMEGYPAEWDIPRYIAAGRSVWEQELNLTATQRIEVRDFLEWNAQPDNKFYRYDYYLDNCSTRVRDVIDRVTGGNFHAQMTGPGAGTYRFHTQRLNTNNPPLYAGLLLALGQRADRPASRWEEMFLPLKLHEYLRTATTTDSAGVVVPLVSSERTIFQSDRFPVPDRPPEWWPGFLGLGLLLGGLMAWGGRAGGRLAIARRLFGLVGTGWALLTGVAGAILAGLWAFTDHVMAGRNENVLQCTLLALALGLLLPWMIGGKGWARRSGTALALAVGALSLLGLLLKLLPIFDQVNGQILALTVPANLGLAAGVWWYTHSPTANG